MTTAKAWGGVEMGVLALVSRGPPRAATRTWEGFPAKTTVWGDGKRGCDQVSPPIFLGSGRGVGLSIMSEIQTPWSLDFKGDPDKNNQKALGIRRHLTFTETGR